MQNLYDVIARALSRDNPRPKVQVLVRAPDGAQLCIIGRIYEDRIVDEERHEVYPFRTFPIEKFL